MPDELARIRVDDADEACPPDVRDLMGAGTQGRRYGSVRGADHVDACAVADDHAQGGAGEVSDPVALVRPARERDVLLVRFLPADVALRVERDELACVQHARDEEPVGRPRSVAVRSEPPPRAVLLDDPRPASGLHQQPTGRRQPYELTIRVADADDLLAPDGVADRIDDGASRRCERCSDDRDHGGGERELARMAPRPRHAFALEVRGAHDVPRAPARVVLAGDLDSLEIALHSSRSFSLSSPRRRRELTVPRGRSSRSAISPGVYSRRYRRTITARWSASKAASAGSNRSSGCGDSGPATSCCSASARSFAARAQSIARLTAIRCSHGPKGRLRSNRSSARTAARNASCAMSSAAAASCTTRYAAR